MRKIVSILLAGLLATVLVAGCGKEENKPAATGKAVTIKLGHVEAEDRSTHKAALEFKKYVEEESKGRIKVELHPNAVLGGDVQLSESVALGTIQMALPSTSVLTMYSPEFGVLDMPFLFKDPTMGFAALDGDVGARLDKHLEKVGIKNLGYNYNGPRCMTNNRGPINEPADLAGIKMRVMESPVFIQMFKLLGANPTPMSFSELFTALQQGTVDAQENPPSLIYASRFQEVQKYLSLTNHVNNFLAVLINAKFYNSLAPEDQKLVAEAAKKYLVDAQREMELKDNSVYIKKLKDAGMKVNEITPENHQKFVQALQPMYAKYEGELGKDLFDLVKKYNK